MLGEGARLIILLKKGRYNKRKDVTDVTRTKRSGKKRAKSANDQKRQEGRRAGRAD
jgi:hypothetical protein